MDLQLLAMEIQDMLPIEIDDSEISEEQIWELIEGLSGGFLHSENTLIVLNRNQITHLKLINKKATRNFKPGNIVVPVQARELVLESYQEFTLFYDNDVKFDSAYLVIEYKEGSSTVLLEELDSKKRDVFPIHWFELAEVFGSRWE